MMMTRFHRFEQLKFLRFDLSCTASSHTLGGKQTYMLNKERERVRVCVLAVSTDGTPLVPYMEFSFSVENPSVPCISPFILIEKIVFVMYLLSVLLKPPSFIPFVPSIIELEGLRLRFRGVLLLGLFILLAHLPLLAEQRVLFTRSPVQPNQSSCPFLTRFRKGF